MPTIADALRWADSVLRETGNSDALRDARLLLAEALCLDLARLLTHPEQEISPAQLSTFQRWVSERRTGRPPAYIVGHREFYGRDFFVSPAVLIPRPETELLVEQGLRILGVRFPAPGSPSEPQSSPRQGGSPAPGDALSVHPSGLLLADIGTGSGCIAVTLAAEIPGAEIVATDVSEDALSIARKNARRHAVSGRVEFRRADLLPDGLELYDAIFSNPPYVATGDAALSNEVRSYEPAAALFAGPSGMEFYPRIVQLAARRLKDEGSLVIELGYQSAERVVDLCRCAVWRDVELFPDLQGIARCLVARRRKRSEVGAGSS